MGNFPELAEGCEQWELDSKETKDREDNIADKRQPLSYISGLSLKYKILSSDQHLVTSLQSIMRLLF